jgi:hypothetical protein
MPTDCRALLDGNWRRLEDIDDTDRQLGIQTPLKTIDMLAAQRMRTLVYHLPWPGLGHFVTRSDGFHFEPEPVKCVNAEQFSVRSPRFWGSQ